MLYSRLAITISYGQIVDLTIYIFVQCKHVSANPVNCFKELTSDADLIFLLM